MLRDAVVSIFAVALVALGGIEVEGEDTIDCF